MRREDDVLRSGADGGGNVSSQTHTDAHSSSCHVCFMAPLHSATPSPGCLLSPLAKLSLFIPSPPPLPVSNSNQSVGQSEGSGGGRGGGHTKEQPMGVSTTPDCGYGTLSLLATSLLGTFPAILIVYHRGDITSRVCLIDCRLIFVHLTAGLDRLAILSSRPMGQ